MKVTLFALLLFVGATVSASVTNALVCSDIASRTYESDYGNLTVSVTDIVTTPKWDERSNPPVSISKAIELATKQLPQLKTGTWSLQQIALNDYDGKGWHYLVAYTTREIFSKDDDDFVIIKEFMCAVLLDGRVIVPTKSTE